MHEFTIARGLVEAAAEEARIAGGSTVRSVNVRVGTMRMVDAWLLQEAWVLASEGTICEQSELRIETARPTTTCTACGNAYELPELDLPCPECGGGGGPILGGDELELTKLDVDIAGDAAPAGAATIATESNKLAEV